MQEGVKDQQGTLERPTPEELLAIMVEAGSTSMRNATIVAEPIPVGLLAEHFARPECGGEVLFAGRVRNHTKGRPVTHLEYEANTPLAEEVMRTVLTEAIEEFDLHDAFCLHRVGSLQPGECAVIVITATPHRKAAYAGNRYIIDEVKKRAPIWKKEFFADGAANWPQG